MPSWVGGDNRSSDRTGAGPSRSRKSSLSRSLPPSRAPRDSPICASTSTSVVVVAVGAALPLTSAQAMASGVLRGERRRATPALPHRRPPGRVASCTLRDPAAWPLPAARSSTGARRRAEPRARRPPHIAALRPDDVRGDILRTSTRTDIRPPSASERHHRSREGPGTGWVETTQDGRQHDPGEGDMEICMYTPTSARRACLYNPRDDHGAGGAGDTVEVSSAWTTSTDLAHEPPDARVLDHFAFLPRLSNAG